MNQAIIKELVMVGLVSTLMATITYIAYCFGKRNGIQEEKMYVIDMLSSVQMTTFAEEIRYGASVAIGHISDKLRKE